jgi:hypothetical protein
MSIVVALFASLIYVFGTFGPSTVSAQLPFETPLGVVLSANQEIPPVTVPTAAGGVGTLLVSADQTQISYELNLTGPFTGDPLQMHIHAGAIGETGPPLFFICATDPSTPVPAPVGVQACPPADGGLVSGTLTEADFVAPAPDAPVGTFAEAVQALISGKTYINLHTPDNPPGEIRGQVGPAGLGTILTSAAEVPPVTTASSAIGAATLTIDPDHAEIGYSLTLTGPFTGNPLQVHIHAGPAGGQGPPVFFLCATDPSTPVPAPAGVPACPDASGGTISGSLTEADFVVQAPDAAVATFTDAIDALMSGGTYINLHTPANPPGEIRGQIEIGLSADLSSDAEVPPVGTPTQDTGTALMVVNRDRSEIAYSIGLLGPFTGDPLQMHIHAGPAGGQGPPVFFLCATDPSTPVPAPAGVQTCPPAAGGTLNGVLTEADFVPQAPDAAVGTFAQAVSALMEGGTYLNVHTPLNPSGEIRGQLESVQPVLISFATDIQPIFTQNCAFAGCHAGPTPAAGLNLEAGQAYANLVGVPSRQVPNLLLNRVEPGDPVNSYLFMKHSGDPRIANSRMPLTNPLFFDQNPDLLELERLWIRQGATNN